MAGALDDYLDLLSGRGQGDGWIELRFRHGSGMRTRFYEATRGRTALNRCVLRLARRRDVYIGCALRTQQRGDRAHVGQAWTLWAECDSETAIEQLRDFELRPSLVVASGTPGHVHAYWSLDAPADADTLETANRRLAAAVGGDPVCFDAARILRPPGTLNHKHSPPRPVTQIGALSREPHRLAAILSAVPQLANDPSPSAEHRPTSDDPLLQIEPSTYVAALLNLAVGRDRKVPCPFHKDHTPSLHVYPTAERGWFCFGCRRGGSIYDLAAAVWDLEARGADFLVLRERLTRMLLTGVVR